MFGSCYHRFKRTDVVAGSRRGVLARFGLADGGSVSLVGAQVPAEKTGSSPVALRSVDRGDACLG